LSGTDEQNDLLPENSFSARGTRRSVTSKYQSIDLLINQQTAKKSSSHGTCTCITSETSIKQEQSETAHLYQGQLWKRRILRRWSDRCDFDNVRVCLLHVSLCLPFEAWAVKMVYV